MANINGWGRGTWNEGAWGTALPVEPTGLAVTSGLGTVSLQCDNNVSPVGLAITSGIGSLTVTAGDNFWTRHAIG